MSERTDSSRGAKLQEIRLGYLPLVDSAPYVIAHELGFASDVGLSLELQQEVSWANIRDKLATGHLDASQMPAPLPAMTRIGISGLRVPLISGLITSRNGNGITVSHRLATCLRPSVGMLDPARVMNLLEELGRDRLTLATVLGFSCHTLLLRRWLQLSGLDPDETIRMIIVPPSQMADTLASGLIDGFCAGEPWNSQAVGIGAGEIACFGAQIWPRHPEKVLSVTEAWDQANRAAHQRLIDAMLQASQWLSIEANHLEAATILARPEYLNMPVSQLIGSFSGRLPVSESATPQPVSELLLFNAVRFGRPDAMEMAQMLQMSCELIGSPLRDGQIERLQEASYRTDLFDHSVAAISPPP